MTSCTSITRIAILAGLIVAVAPLTACASACGRHNPTVTVEVRKARIAPSVRCGTPFR